jgi:hypothetical protein
MSLALLVFSIVFAMSGCNAEPTFGPAADSPPVRTAAELSAWAGQAADMAPYAYQYRADRNADQNPPESWVMLMQYANLPYDKPVDTNAPAIKKVLRGNMWEEVRPVQRVDLSWPADAKRRPSPDEVALSYFEATDELAHTWWNPRTVKEAGKPEVSADGCTYVYTIPVGTWAVVAAIRGGKDASAFDVPAIRAIVPDTWKKMDLEIEWGFQSGRDKLNYGGRVEAYNGVLADVQPLADDRGTTMAEPGGWRSASKGDARRGVRLSVLYIGSPHWPRVWPYHAQAQDVARTILTVWTQSGSFSFNVSDLEQGPILAPEYGFFVRDIAKRQAAAVQKESQPPIRMDSAATTAKEFVKELSARNLSTIRQRVRLHSEQTWDEAVAAMCPGGSLPLVPAPEFVPPMQVQVPCEQLTAQWKLGAWHILRRTPKDAGGKCFFNDYPFGILASETYLILQALDLQGMHKEAAEGLDQWLRLPMKHKIVPGQGGHNSMARPDRPLGNFSDGDGCLTHAEGSPGFGDNMDGIHCMGPGAIMFALWEHFRLTGDVEWLKAYAPRMKANVQWILRQRQLLAGILPGGQRLWSKGLQPAQVVTPDSMCMHMQFYETEAYYWLAVHHMAEMLAVIDPKEGAKMAAEAEAYRKDLLAAIDRSIALTPVVPVRDGTYHSFIPFAPYVRGFASGAWGWQRCQGHVGAIYWDTVQSADPLVSPSGLLSPQDPRVQGHLDVLEDRLLLENSKIHDRSGGHFDAQKDWFDQASWQYQCGLERHANIHLGADDIPNFIRSMLNQYAVDIMPGEYTFREHTTGGPPDKSFEESAFLERFRMMLVMEEGRNLWLARATPRAWLEQGKKISVKHAPTHFGQLAYEITSDVDAGRIVATIEMPTRTPPQAVLLRLRHPKALPIKSVTVNGKAWKDFDADKECVRLSNLIGTVHVTVGY